MTDLITDRLRVGIDYRPAVLLRSGIGRYVRNTVRHLPAMDDDLELSLFSVFFRDHARRLAAAGVAETDRVRLAAARFPGRLVKGLGAVRMLSTSRWTGPVDVFHLTDYVKLPVRDSKIVATIHDVTFLHPDAYHPPANRRRLTAVTQWVIKRADRILTVSETSRREILAHYELPEDRVVVTPLGVDEKFLVPFEPTPTAIPSVLFVGTLEPRKNLPRLLRAFEIVLASGLEAHLHLVGRRGWMCDEVFRLLLRPTLADKVTWLGSVSDDALIELMRSASVLAYPSLWEGFGLPVLEGMAMGLPVLTSDCGALAEVAGDGALRVEPTSVEAIADGLQFLLENRVAAVKLGERGRERARQFTWWSCAEKTAKVYRDVADLDES